MSDDDLIEAAKEGHPHAGAFLVSRYAPQLLGYCRSIASDLSEVDHEHVVALAVENAVRKIDRYDPARAPFRAWLRTFVLHAAQDWRRGHLTMRSLDAARENEAPEIARIAAPSDPSPDPGDNETSHRLDPLIGAMNDALPTLSELDQLIIHLRDFEQRSVEEVAALLDITRDACRQRHHRAKIRLRKLVEADPRAAALFPGDPA